MTTAERTAALLAGPRGRAMCAYASSLGGGNTDCWSRAIVLPHEPGAAAALAAGLREVDVDGLARVEDETLLIEPLRRAVQDAMYWQPPWEYEALLATEEVLATLAPIARALVSSPAAQWWFTGLERETQFGRAFIWGDREVTTPVHAPQTLTNLRADLLSREERARPFSADPFQDASSDWWSAPLQAVWPSSRALAGLPGVGLVLVEECSGDFEEALVWSVEVDPAARVYEIDSPAAWVELVLGHPLDVSRSKRGDWARTTGRDGAWAMPDWLSVSQEWDGVHLTVAGYLSAATRALVLGDGRATVMAGFSPDETYWLRDVVRVGEGRRWRSPHNEAGTAAWAPV